MPPKVPQSLVAALSPALVFLYLLSSSSFAQDGYAELRAEQGSNLAPTSGTEQDYIAAESSAWRYWTGDLGEPASDWRTNGFVEPTGWQDGQTSIGYGDMDDETTLTNMEDNFTSVYLRHEFQVAAGEVPSMLHLRLYVDDGAIVWLNGNEIARMNVTTPAPAVGATATSMVDNATWHDFFLPGTGDIVVEGTNTIAIHSLNASIDSSDLSIDLELTRPRLDFGQVEGSSGGNYLPAASPESSPAIGYEFQGDAQLAIKTFEIRSNSAGLSFSRSTHALFVSDHSYRFPTRPGYFLTNIKNWEAGGFLDSDGLNSGFVAPEPSLTQVQNHSWIATDSNFANSSLNNKIRRFDYANARDGVLAAVGLNNGSGTAVPQIWGSAYNAISVGRIDGNHSRGGTVTGVDGDGRSKPDIIALGNSGATSYSTANVSGTAAMLLGIAYHDPELSNVYHPEVSKALMMASATKQDDWSHTSSAPLDPVWGAGRLNVYDCYHLMQAGEHSAGTTVVPENGWDYAEVAANTTASYTFVIPEEAVADRCSILLTWFRQFEDDPASNNFASLPVVADFEMRLFESQNGVTGTELALSDSAVDNVEHVYLEDLPAGEYTINISSDIASSYAIAWETRLRGLPQVAVKSVSSSEGSASVDLENLVEGVAYTLQYSTDLIGWIDLHTVTAGTEPESYVQTSIPSGEKRGFYRLTWTEP